MRQTLPALLCCTLALLTASCQRSPQAYLAKGNELFAAGKTAEAILNYKKAVQQDRQFGEAYYRLGLAELKSGNVPNAYGALVIASRFLPSRVDVKVTLADFLLLAYIQDKNRPDAYYRQIEKLVNDLITRDPHSYDAYRIKGYIAWMEERFGDADEFFSKANAAKPMMPDLVVSWVQVLLRTGREADAEKLARELIQAHKDAAGIYDVLYGHYRFQNRLADSENILRAKTGNNPRDIDYALELAAFYAGIGKRDQMEAVIQSLLRDPKSYPTAHLKVGDFYGALHEWSEALRQYQEAAKADPKNKTRYLKRIADAWLSQGKGEEAAGVVGQILKEQPDDTAAKAVNASLLLKTGTPEKVDAGMHDLENLVKKDPDNSAVRFALARALLLKGDPHGAALEFQELVKRRPRHIPSLLALTELSLAKKDYAKALQYINVALAVNPKLGPARLLHATILGAQQNFTQARSELDSLAKAVPQDLEIQFQLAAIDLAEKKFPEAEARLQQLYPKQKTMALAGLVQVYAAEGQLDKAVARLTVELGKAPKSPAIQAMAADTFLRAGKYDEALERYRQMQAAGVRSVSVQMHLGEIYERKGDLDKAIASFQAAQKMVPGDAAVTLALADGLRLAGNNNEAIQNYRVVLKLDPESANALNNLAYTLLDTGGSPDEAETLVAQALKKSPENPGFGDTLGMIYLKKNLRDSSLQVFRKLVQRYPNEPAYRYHYGLALAQNGDKALANTEFQVALRAAPPGDLRRSIQTNLAKVQ